MNRLLATLRDMLTYCRPCDSATERAFIRKYVLSLPGVEIDDHQNCHVLIGDSPTVIYSCHTDTVHRSQGRQRVHQSRADVMSVSYFHRETSSCLGADDTAGVFLCREMVLARKPGHYIFHFGEEVGGIGSGDLARHTPALLGDAQIAIAFDRKGTADAITHQMCGRTCSDAFAESLSRELNELIPGGTYIPDPTGSYTDTAEYVRLIPECTNISVGYEYAHSSRETLDGRHVLALRTALLALDASKLIVERDPTVPDPDDCRGRGYGPIDWSLWSEDVDDQEDEDEDKDVWQNCGSLFKDEDEDEDGDRDEDDRPSQYLDPAFGRVQDLLKRLARKGGF